MFTVYSTISTVRLYTLQLLVNEKKQNHYKLQYQYYKVDILIINFIFILRRLKSLQLNLGFNIYYSGVFTGGGASFTDFLTF